MRKTILLLTLLLGLSRALIGQAAPRSQAALDPTEKRAAIEALCLNLESEYIFPEITAEYVSMLRDNLRSGKYDRIVEPTEFAEAVTNDLMSVHRDLHLSLRYNPAWVKDERGRKELDEDAIRLQDRRDRMSNYGFAELKILPGNIGYLKLNGFTYNTNAQNAAVGAMSFLSNADAVILDLRANGGGSPEMVQFLCSYFLSNPRQHLNSFSYRDPEKLTQYWTYTYLPSKRLDKIDLYILTSENTFSAAEEFTYNLKNLKRATVVGETTGGGAHDNKFVILTDNFMMSLPFARAVNPVTKTNWEEVGVEPDLKVAQSKALETAEILASRKLAEKEQVPGFKAFYEWRAVDYEAALNPPVLTEAALRSCVGTYGPRVITRDGDALFYSRDGRPKRKMIPVANDVFRIEGVGDFRLRFVREGSRVVAVEGLNPSGAVDKHSKDK